MGQNDGIHLGWCESDHLHSFALTHPPAQYGLALINIPLGRTDFSCLGSPSTSKLSVWLTSGRLRVSAFCGFVKGGSFPDPSLAQNSNTPSEAQSDPELSKKSS
jgi:hypothetical protein